MSIRDCFLATLVVCIWSSNFIAGKFALETAPPLFVTFLRFALTALVLVPFVKVPRAQFKPILFMTFTLGLLHFGLIMVALQKLDASTSAIAIQCGVPFSLVLSAIFLHEKMKKQHLIGIIIAFVGVLVLVGEPNIFENPFSFFLLIIAAMSWAVSNLQSRSLKDINPFTLNAYFSLFFAPQILIVSLIYEESPFQSLVNINPTFILSILYMVFMTTIVAYTLWYKLTGKYNISLVAPFNLLGPVFGVVISYFLLDETIGIMKIIGGAIIISGVSLLVINPKTTK
jgi:O-acetylserine/cysteine efflux transporter